MKKMNLIPAALVLLVLLLVTINIIAQEADPPSQTPTNNPEDQQANQPEKGDPVNEVPPDEPVEIKDTKEHDIGKAISGDVEPDKATIQNKDVEGTVKLNKEGKETEIEADKDFSLKIKKTDEQLEYQQKQIENGEISEDEKSDYFENTGFRDSEGELGKSSFTLKESENKGDIEVSDAQFWTEDEPAESSEGGDETSEASEGEGGDEESKREGWYYFGGDYEYYIPKGTMGEIQTDEKGNKEMNLLIKEGAEIKEPRRVTEEKEGGESEGEDKEKKDFLVHYHLINNEMEGFNMNGLLSFDSNDGQFKVLSKDSGGQGYLEVDGTFIQNKWESEKNGMVSLLNKEINVNFNKEFPEDNKPTGANVFFNKEEGKDPSMRIYAEDAGTWDKIILGNKNNLIDVPDDGYVAITPRNSKMRGVADIKIENRDSLGQIPKVSVDQVGIVENGKAQVSAYNIDADVEGGKKTEIHISKWTNEDLKTSPMELEINKVPDGKKTIVFGDDDNLIMPDVPAIGNGPVVDGEGSGVSGNRGSGDGSVSGGTDGGSEGGSETGEKKSVLKSIYKSFFGGGSSGTEAGSEGTINEPKIGDQGQYFDEQGSLGNQGDFQKIGPKSLSSIEDERPRVTYNDNDAAEINQNVDWNDPENYPGYEDLISGMNKLGVNLNDDKTDIVRLDNLPDSNIRKQKRTENFETYTQSGDVSKYADFTNIDTSKLSEDDLQKLQDMGIVKQGEESTYVKFDKGKMTVMSGDNIFQELNNEIRESAENNPGSGAGTASSGDNVKLGDSDEPLTPEDLDKMLEMQDFDEDTDVVNINVDNVGIDQASNIRKDEIEFRYVEESVAQDESSQVQEPVEPESPPAEQVAHERPAQNTPEPKFDPNAGAGLDYSSGGDTVVADGGDSFAKQIKDFVSDSRKEIENEFNINKESVKNIDISYDEDEDNGVAQYYSEGTNNIWIHGSPEYAMSGDVKRTIAKAEISAEYPDLPGWALTGATSKYSSPERTEDMRATIDYYKRSNTWPKVESLLSSGRDLDRHPDLAEKYSSMNKERIDERYLDMDSMSSSVYDFLLTKGSQQELIDFAYDGRKYNYEDALQEHYGMTMTDLQSQWQDWAVKDVAKGGSVKRFEAVPEPQISKTVFTGFSDRAFIVSDDYDQTIKVLGGSTSESYLRAVANQARFYADDVAKEWFGEVLPPGLVRPMIDAKISSDIKDVGSQIVSKGGWNANDEGRNIDATESRMWVHGKDPQSVFNVLHHEMTHAVFAVRFPSTHDVDGNWVRTFPHWAEEAIASDYDEQFRKDWITDALEYYRTSRNFPDLKEVFKFNPNVDRYTPSVSVKHYLLSLNPSKPNFVNFALMGHLEGYDKALQKYYGREGLNSMTQLQRDWQNWVINNP